jgi:hypothetical protein
MTIYCSGKQGAAFYLRNSLWTHNGLPSGYTPRVEIYEPSRDLNNPPRWGMWEKESPTDLIILFESTPIRVERYTVTPDAYATWRVYTSDQTSTGSVTTYRGLHGKLHSEWFEVRSTWNSQLKVFQHRLAKNTTPQGSSLRSWTSSRSSSFSRQDFSHGSPPVTNHRILITSAEGFKAYEFTKDTTPLDFSVHCGCEHGNCQQGTFPLKYCCFSCSDVNGWLRGIRFDAEETKHEIQDKLGVPRTYNREV